MAENRPATTADVEKSIQIALDAADAAMDVTSEYSKVAQQIRKSTGKLASIEKFGRISIIIGLVSGLSFAALSLVIFMQASSKLKLLTETNTELLTVFVENVDSFNDGLAKLEPSLMQIEKLAVAVTGVKESIDSFEARTNELGDKVNVSIERTNTVVPDVVTKVESFQEKISVMNSELTMSLAEMMNEEIKTQNMIMGNFTKSVIESLRAISDDTVDVKETQQAVDKLQEVNEELAARNATLVQKLEAARNATEALRRQAPKKSTKKSNTSGDIIKYP